MLAQIPRQPLITVGITTFNAADTIENVLSSVINQTYRPIEVIIVDDCSSDNTIRIIETTDMMGLDVNICQNPFNIGVAGARNRIIQEAKGDFVVFFDDDDVSLPERVVTQLNRILSYEKCFAKGAPVICHSARSVLYPDGSVHEESTMGTDEKKLAPNGMRVAEWIMLGPKLETNSGACPTCSQMARLSTYKKLGGFDSVFKRSEDTEFNVRLAKKGGHFVGIAKPLVIQKMTKTSDKNLNDELHYTLLMLEKHRDIADKYNLYAFRKAWLEIKYHWLKKQKLTFCIRLIVLVIKYPKATLFRLIHALPNMQINKAFSNFHTK